MVNDANNNVSTNGCRPILGRDKMRCKKCAVCGQWPCIAVSPMPSPHVRRMGVERLGGVLLIAVFLAAECGFGAHKYLADWFVSTGGFGIAHQHGQSQCTLPCCDLA